MRAADDPLTVRGPGLQRHDRRAGVDADPHLQGELRLSLVQLADRLDDPQPGPNGPLGIVLVSNRRAEDRHHCVADELLDRAAVPFELMPQTRVVRADTCANILGVGCFGGGGEADQVAEEDRHDLALLARLRHDGERGPAPVAEFRGRDILGAARWAGHWRSLEHAAA
jgi:hypothetical protein